LHRVTKAKLLWIYILRTLVIEGVITLPPYRKSIESLTSGEIEALARRTAQLKCCRNSGELVPKSVTPLNLPQSVTWLRLVNGRWLLVTSSDLYFSKLTCWDTSLLRESSEPIAECSLSGPVKSGKVEVQADGVVIALDVESM
jgi:hypothetical protein